MSLKFKFFTFFKRFLCCPIRYFSRLVKKYQNLVAFFHKIMISISIESKSLAGPSIDTSMTLSKVVVIMQFQCFYLIQYCT